MSTAVDSALTEVLAALTVIEPIIEGLNDDLRLNIQPVTRDQVTALLNADNTRHALLLACRDACKALLADGYPIVVTRKVDTDVYTDLQNQFNTIQAALTQFNTEAPVTSAEIHLGKPVPQ